MKWVQIIGSDVGQAADVLGLASLTVTLSRSWCQADPWETCELLCRCRMMKVAQILFIHGLSYATVLLSLHLGGCLPGGPARHRLDDIPKPSFRLESWERGGGGGLSQPGAQVEPFSSGEECGWIPEAPRALSIS